MDLFDHDCYKRMFLRAWRHENLRAQSTQGTLLKAARGDSLFTYRSWEKRWLELRGNVILYYRHADAIAAKAAEVDDCRARFIAFGGDAAALVPRADISRMARAAAAHRSAPPLAADGDGVAAGGSSHTPARGAVKPSPAAAPHPHGIGHR